MSVLAPLIALCVGVCPRLCEFRHLCVDTLGVLKCVGCRVCFGGYCCVTFMHLCIVILDLFICTVPLYSKNQRRRFVIVFIT